MPFCSNRILTIDVRRDSDGVLLNTLTFGLTITGGVISGPVQLSNGTVLSQVTGSCQPIARPDVGLMNIRFTWRGVTVFMVGLVFEDVGVRRTLFQGRFVALAGPIPADEINASEIAPTVQPEIAPAVQPEIPPDDGDTGTATGQQT